MHNKLSAEIFAKIMEEVREDCFSLVDFVKVTRWVCRGWATLANGTPTLWRNVDLDEDLRFVKIQLENSKKVDLDVVGTVDATRQDVLSILAHQAGRIRSLDLDIERHSEQVFENILTHTPFPALRRLVLEGPADPTMLQPSLTFPHPSTMTIHPQGLLELRLRNVAFELPYLTPHSLTIHTFSLDNRHLVESVIDIDDLVSILPTLKALRRLNLGGRVELLPDEGLRRSADLSALNSFTFIGQSTHLELLIATFHMPHVQTWRVQVSSDITAGAGESGIRPVVETFGRGARRVELRWLNRGKSEVRICDDAKDPALDLKIISQNSSPFRALTTLLGEDMQLDCVTRLLLHGGPDQLQVDEDDDCVLRGIKALPNVRSLEFCGNSSSWGRVAVVLEVLRRQEEVVWRGMKRIEFSNGVVFGYILKDWHKWLSGRKEMGEGIPRLVMTGLRLQGGSDADARAMTELLSWDVDRMKGNVERGRWAGGGTPNAAWRRFRGRKVKL